MQYNDNAQLDSSQMGGGGGGGGGRIAIGGGIGGTILILILSLVFGVDLSGLTGGGSTSADPQAETSRYSQCRTGADVRTNRDCRFVAYTNSIQQYWSTQVKGYETTKTITFTGRISTGCGTADSSVGPFYCPAQGDHKVYLDTGFFDQLQSQFGARGGDAAEAYVIAHEYGHHVSNLLGKMDWAAQDRSTGPNSRGVKIELQADCFAGAWLAHASDDPNSPITQVTQDDVNRALDAAAAVGDDRIQQKSQGQVTPETWTHGSSQQRQQATTTGFQSGPNACLQITQ
ncbi:KPN_02809 family neutral zinc metallopeptidase [Granulicoccus phenolivorans]|uniref:KPN_02809 family neutral zinc metallopeptidase n=1 Tax=Granulicoccus phenolivorans TaxID=266854 RepID=UPI0003F7F8A2|nr:neutral zinc metallopeptidase [Granulicoccus phenolivorans]